MRANRIETVLQWCSDVERSTDWYRRFLVVETAPCEAPYFPR